MNSGGLPLLTPKISSKRIMEGLSAILELRGYKILKTQDQEEGIDIIAEMKGESGKKVRLLAHIPEKEVVGVKIIRDIIKRVEEEGFTRVLISAKEKFTPYAKREANEAQIELLAGPFPLFDIFAHELVPDHKFATKEEINELQRKFGIKLSQLPKISTNDPVARTLGARVGDVLRITRESATTKTSSVYRVVIED